MAGIHFRGHFRVSYFRSLLVLFLIFFPILVSAEGPFGPPGNTDLKQIQSGIDKIMSTTQHCRGMECPRINCASANELVQSMINAEMTLDDMLKWLLEAGAIHREDFACKAKDRDITDQQLSQGYNTLALQTYFHTLGDAILKVVAFSDFVKGLDRGFFTFDTKNFDLFMNKLDKTINAINNLDGAQQMIRSRYGDSNTVIPQGIKTVIDSKSFAVDARRELDAIKREMLGRSTQDPTPHVKNIGIILARVLKMCSQEQIDEMKTWLADLEKNAGAENLVMDRSSEERQRIVNRFYEGKDVLANLRAARKHMIGCMASAKCSIKGFKFYPGIYENNWLKALTQISNRLPALTKPLTSNIELIKSDCKNEGDKPGNQISNNCPSCQSLADEVGRKMDEQRYFDSESDRITIIKEKQTHALKEQLVIEEGKLAGARREIERIRKEIYKNDQKLADNVKPYFYASVGVGVVFPPALGAVTAYYFVYDMLCSAKLAPELQEDLSLFMRDTWPPLIRANTLKAQIERIEAENDSVGEIKLRLIALSGAIREKRMALAKCQDEKCPQKSACAACQSKADELKKVSDELRDKELSVKELEARSRDNAEAKKQADSIKMGNSMLALKKKQLEEELGDCQKEQCNDDAAPGGACAPLKKIDSRKGIEQILNGYIRSIDKMEAEVNKTYSLSNGRLTMRTALQNVGVRRFLDHGDSWAGWMWTFWQYMEQGFYQGHRRIVDDALQKVRTGKVPSRQRLEEINSGMCRFETVHRQVLDLMKRYVQKDVKRGLSYEEYQRFLDDYYYKVKDSPEKEARKKAALKKHESELQAVAATMQALDAEHIKIAQTRLF